jgi:hypothetical protein
MKLKVFFNQGKQTRYNDKQRLPQPKTERACVLQASKDAILDIHTCELIVRLVYS